MGPGLVRLRAVGAGCVFLSCFSVFPLPAVAQNSLSAGSMGFRIDGPNPAQSDAGCVADELAFPVSPRLTARCTAISVSAPVSHMRPTLCSLGAPCLVIEQARMHALQILSSQNGCSVWFREADPDVIAVLESLEYALHNGPKYVQAYRSDSGEMLFRHPYSAVANEGAGRGATIVLNRNGPFFVGAADIFLAQSRASPAHFAGRRSLSVGSFAGATLPAQITTLLHELAHIVGRIPNDSDDSTFQSPENTERVLNYCRGAIKANLRHSGR